MRSLKLCPDCRWRADTILVWCPRCCDVNLEPCEECGSCGKAITPDEDRPRRAGGRGEPAYTEPACVFCLPDDQREREQAARDAAYERRLDEARENGWA